MRTVIVENVETAEAKKQRLATTAVDAALEILRTEASGLVIEAAAPLVFQGLCRRDNIRVEFTQTPMTNGRVIWLGPIDLGHKLASIYVYGHGCHERHHVMYTNFAAMRGIGDPGVRDLANVFEDIRVDKLGAADYEGYLLWRLVLFKALKAVEEAAGEGSTDNFEFRQGEGQSLLFDDDGAVTPEGDPRLMHPELEAINRNARCLSVISDQRQWPDREPEEESFRKLIGNGESGNGDPNFASPERHFANDREYPTLQPEKAAMNRRLFYRALASSASLRRLLQSALLHPQSNPDRLDERGEELDGDALALASTGETAVFRRELVRPGREAVVEIILDASGSMEGEAITLAKVACIRLLEALRAVTGVKASLTIFPGPNRRSVTCAADFNTPVSRALKHVDFLPGFGATPILQALFHSAIVLDQRPEPAKIVFVITDGWFPKGPVDNLVKALEDRGIAVAMVGIGRHSTPKGSIIAKAEKIADLPRAVAKVLSGLAGKLRGIAA